MSAEAARREIERVLPQGMVTEEDIETWLAVMRKYWDGLQDQV